MPKQPSKTARFAARSETARRVYAFIGGFVAENGHSPSMAEIAEACYMSRGNVVRYLDLLEAWGWITRTPGLARSISLRNRGPRL